MAEPEVEDGALFGDTEAEKTAGSEAKTKDEESDSSKAESVSDEAES